LACSGTATSSTTINTPENACTPGIRSWGRSRSSDPRVRSGGVLRRAKDSSVVAAASDKGSMAFDTLVSNAGRLEILTALAVEETQDFVTLRKRTRLTDGNLASHAKRLQEAGLV